MSNIQPGDVTITTLKLFSDDGCRSHDLRGQVHYVDIYESILNPVVYAELVIEDAQDLLRQFPIIAEEYVEIEFNTPGSDTPVSYKLHVKGVKDLVVSESQKFKGYNISLVSQELLDNANKQVNKRFKSDISAAISDIIQNELKSKKRMNIEATRGIDDVLVSKMTPLKAIDLLRRRAVSKQFSSSSFVFYENKHGYNFETIERIFDRNKKSVGDKIFTFLNTAQADSKGSAVRNIISYRQVSFADAIDKIMHGGLSNKVAALDMVSGGYTVINYTAAEGNDKFIGSDVNGIGQNSSSFERAHGRTTSKTMLMPTAADRNESFLTNKLSILQAYTQKLTQNLVHIYIYGDSEITVGDVIECNLPEGQGYTKDDKIDRLASGKYLAAKVRHCLTLGPKPVYTQSLELIKTNFLESA